MNFKEIIGLFRDEGLHCERCPKPIFCVKKPIALWLMEHPDDDDKLAEALKVQHDLIPLLAIDSTLSNESQDDMARHSLMTVFLIGYIMGKGASVTLPDSKDLLSRMENELRKN